MGNQKQQKSNQEVKQEAMKVSFGSGTAVPAVIEDVIGRTGFRGEVTQVKCRIMQGNEQGKTMRRNVKGPIRLRDIIMLRETQIEARRIRSKIRKGAFT